MILTRRAYLLTGHVRETGHPRLTPREAGRVDLRAELCNEHKECLDQVKLTQDLGRLRVYAGLHRLKLAYKLTDTP